MDMPNDLAASPPPEIAIAEIEKELSIVSILGMCRKGKEEYQSETNNC